MNRLKSCILAGAAGIAQLPVSLAASPDATPGAQLPPIQYARPWIVGHMVQWGEMTQWGEMPPEPAQNNAPQPAPVPQPIQGRLPDAPGYPTATQRDSLSAYNLQTLRAWTQALQNMPYPSDPAYPEYYARITVLQQYLRTNDIGANDPAMRNALRAYQQAWSAWYGRAMAMNDYQVRYNEWVQQRWDAYYEEQSRLQQHAQRLYEQNAAWNRMVDERFNNTAWDAFNASNGALTTLQFESIYANYDPRISPPTSMSLSAAGTSLSSVSWSLSSAGTSLSSAGWSLSAAGIPLTNGTNAFSDPSWQSLSGMTGRNPFADRNTDSRALLADAAYRFGNMEVRRNPTGRESLESGGYVAASLFTYDDPYLRLLMNNGRTGLDRLLAQPFNVVLTWGEGAYDLDLHMTGPLGEGVSERFHIYYAASGDLDGQPYAALIKDCVCNSGSEVILTSALNRGGVYRVSVFNYGDQSASSSNLSNASSAQIQIVRGGATESVGNGTTIVGGRTILTTTVPNGGVGNTWTAVELDPRSGRITVPRNISQSSGSGDVP